jgi:hypothetical protein
MLVDKRPAKSMDSAARNRRPVVGAARPGAHESKLERDRLEVDYQTGVKCEVAWLQTSRVYQVRLKGEWDIGLAMGAQVTWYLAAIVCCCSGRAPRS